MTRRKYRDFYKPHLRRTGIWYCRGGGWVGYGQTMLDAYMAWHRAVFRADASV